MSLISSLAMVPNSRGEGGQPWCSRLLGSGRPWSSDGLELRTAVAAAGAPDGA